MSCPHCTPTTNRPAEVTQAAISSGNFTVALAGNPNAGKTTIFNALTGTRQHVGNWPGKTVEKKEGFCEIAGHPVTVVDLPGTYSLSAYSADEIIAMDYLLDGEPDVVVIVIDAGNLERNLYLAVQILEMELPVILVLNMLDSAQARGLTIDYAALSRHLGNVPIIPTVAVKEQGVDALKAAILDLLHTPTSVRTQLLLEAAR